MKYLSPKDYGLPGRTKIAQLDDNTFALVVDRKSRIIMADGERIFEKIVLLKKKLQPATTVVLSTTAPVCSKTKVYLENNGISIRPL